MNTTNNKWAVIDCKCDPSPYNNDNWHFLIQQNQRFSFCSKCGAGNAPAGFLKKGYTSKILVDDETFNKIARCEITDEEAYDEFKYADDHQ